MARPGERDSWRECDSRVRNMACHGMQLRVPFLETLSSPAFKASGTLSDIAGIRIFLGKDKESNPFNPVL